MASAYALLLVSDEPTHDLLRCWLADSGWAVKSLDDGDDVGQAVQTQDARLLVTDRIHRIGAGNATIQDLRVAHPALRVVVVPVRSYQGDDMFRLARAVGAHAVLAEPLSRAGLAQALV